MIACIGNYARLMCLVSLNDLALDLYNFDPNIKLGNWTLLLICELNKYVSRMGILVTGAGRQCSLLVLSCRHLQHGMDQKLSLWTLNTEPFLHLPRSSPVNLPPGQSTPTPPRPNGSDRGFPRAIWTQRGGKFMQPSWAELSSDLTESGKYWSVTPA